MSATEIMAQVRNLPPGERLKIAEQIWAECREDLDTPETLAELDRRADDFFRNPNNGVPWEQVRADLRQRFGWE